MLDDGYSPQECGSDCYEPASESHKFEGTSIHS